MQAEPMHGTKPTESDSSAWMQCSTQNLKSIEIIHRPICGQGRSPLDLLRGEAESYWKRTGKSARMPGISLLLLEVVQATDWQHRICLRPSESLKEVVMSETHSGSRPSTMQLIMVPSVITLAVTILRLVGELQQWSPRFFSTAAGGGGAIVGISWLPILFGPYFALKLAGAAAGPESKGKAIGL